MSLVHFRYLAMEAKIFPAVFVQITGLGALRVSECVVDRGTGFGVAQHVGVLAGTR